ncbi:methyltransferase-like protein 7B [Caerostris extrusa]|uniref:Methyltransferase-like protein 7B n=1 Tax=Caerostris extrusa TaxID=172846 RepID=A0AAV4PBS5_CAEEX|nr:methyltransferase-like protein 7B [Caerostris extrusa]
MSAVSCLLPLVVLLKVNKTFRNKFSVLYMELFGFVVRQMEPIRKRAFEILQEHLPNRKLSTPLEILEIGVGGGANLEYYPENSNLTALDKNDTFSNYFNDHKKKFSHVTYKKMVSSMAEKHGRNRRFFDGRGRGTYVLCSVQDVKAVIKESEACTEASKFLFVEHVAFPDSHLGSKVQNFAAPLWRLFCDGCNINRKPSEEIRKGGFSNVECENQFPSNAWLFLRPQFIGIATK